MVYGVHIYPSFLFSPCFPPLTPVSHLSFHSFQPWKVMLIVHSTDSFRQTDYGSNLIQKTDASKRGPPPLCGGDIHSMGANKLDATVETDDSNAHMYC